MLKKEIKNSKTKEENEIMRMLIFQTFQQKKNRKNTF